MRSVGYIPTKRTDITEIIYNLTGGDITKRESVLNTEYKVAIEWYEKKNKEDREQMLNKGFITAMAFHDPQGLQKLLPGGEIAENYKSDMEEEIAKYKEGVKKGTIKIG